MEHLMSLMVLIWTLNITLSLLSKFFGFKVDKSILGCGITAYCGKIPADPAWIKMIMMYNEERGEDSTGWAVNNKITKDAEKVTKFIQTNPLIVTPQDDNFTIIAHARKASSGHRYSKELAHPFGIYENDTEKENYDLILAMNGTLSNTELLAKKWGIDFKNGTNSDTQMLAKAIVKLGEENYIEALELYDGWATLVFFRPKDKNTLMVYKDPDRPLFCWNPNKDQMYISSIQEPLLAVGADKKQVLTFRNGELYTIEAGRILENEKIIRTPERPPVINNSLGRGMGFNNKHKHYNSEYDAYDTYYFPNESILTGKSKEKISLKKRIEESSYHDNRGNRIYTINERYFRNGHFVHGKFYITDSGKVKTDTEGPNSKNTNVYFFVNGYMCKSEKDYDSVVTRCLNENGGFSVDNFIAIRLSEFIENFQYPIITSVDREEKWILNSEYAKNLRKSGDNIHFTPFLSEEEFVMIYKEQQTKVGKKTICEIGDVKKASITSSDPNEDLMSEENEPETIRYLLERFKTDPSDSPHYYNAMIKKELWRVNPSETLKEYVFILILKMALKESVINKKQFEEMKVEGGKNYFSGKEFVKEMEVIIKNFKKKLKETADNKIGSKKTTKEKIKVLEEDPEEFTQKDVIASIKICNPFFSNNHFTNDIYHAKSEELNEIKDDWVKINSDLELYDFYEAVLLSLNVVDRISDSELLYALDSHSVDLAHRAHEAYKSWHTFNLDCNQCDADLQDKSKNDQENEEPVTDMSVDTELLEKKDAKYYEEEYASEAEELIETMKEMYDRMENVEVENRSPKFIRMKAQLAATARNMEKYIKEDPADKN